MSVKKDKDERFRQRTITLPPEINEFLDTFPKGSASQFVARAIRRSTEYRKYTKRE